MPLTGLGVLGKLGYEWAGECHHVPFGLILGMSTRKGTMVLLDAVLQPLTVLARAAGLGAAVARQIDLDRHRFIGQLEVDRLVFFMHHAG